VWACKMGVSDFCAASVEVRAEAIVGLHVKRPRLLSDLESRLECVHCSKLPGIKLMKIHSAALDFLRTD
jgi:hypothetical protein